MAAPETTVPKLDITIDAERRGDEIIGVRITPDSPEPLEEIIRTGLALPTLLDIVRSLGTEGWRGPIGPANVEATAILRGKSPLLIQPPAVSYAGRDGGTSDPPLPKKKKCFPEPQPDGGYTAKCE